MPLPRARDYHKKGTPLVPSSYGVFFVIVSVIWWYAFSYIDPDRAPLAIPLAGSVLFGGFMGLLDDLVDLRWRYKALFPLVAGIPLLVISPIIHFATIHIPLLGSVSLPTSVVVISVPIFVTIVTNTVNQLGGLNGLEAISGSILMIGLEVATKNFVLLSPPILVMLVLSYLSFTGKAFIGNTGSFAIGLTTSVFAVLVGYKTMFIFSLTPFIFNSLLILFSRFFLNSFPSTIMGDDGKLRADKVRSLRTLILKIHPMTEHEAVIVICAIVAVFVALAIVLAPILQLAPSLQK
jgi:UDP-N-acetylglucosamine--dolichyl-phosphate N-acetylglucosaminephosphotransferase